MKFKRLAIDTSKHVFTLHGVDEQERPVLRRELKRANVETSLPNRMQPRWCWRPVVAPATGVGC
jgi:hypothetical protein